MLIASVFLQFYNFDPIIFGWVVDPRSSVCLLCETRRVYDVRPDLQPISVEISDLVKTPEISMSYFAYVRKSLDK